MNLKEDIRAVSRLTLTRGDTRAASAPGHGFLTFRLGTEEYGIAILKVQEIRGYENPTRIANTPAFIKGVIDLRGVIVPIVDMRMKFNLATVDYDAFTVVVVLNVADRVVGVVVDSVSDVLELNAEQIKPAPEFNDTVGTGFITGLGRLKQDEQERMLILIDVEQLLTSTEMGLANGSIQ